MSRSIRETVMPQSFTDTAHENPCALIKRARSDCVCISDRESVCMCVKFIEFRINVLTFIQH